MKGEDPTMSLFGISLTGRPKWQQLLLCSSGFFFGYLVNGVCEVLLFLFMSPVLSKVFSTTCNLFSFYCDSYSDTSILFHEANLVLVRLLSSSDQICAKICYISSLFFCSRNMFTIDYNSGIVLSCHFSLLPILIKFLKLISYYVLAATVGTSRLCKDLCILPYYTCRASPRLRWRIHGRLMLSCPLFLWARMD